MKVQIVSGCPQLVAQSLKDKGIVYDYMEHILSSLCYRAGWNGLDEEEAWQMLSEFYIHFPIKFDDVEDEYFFQYIEKLVKSQY